MAGLGPAIHVFSLCRNKDVDARDKPGHDEFVEAHRADGDRIVRAQEAAFRARAALPSPRSYGERLGVRALSAYPVITVLAETPPHPKRI
jgi:hypothetical protein